MAKLTQSLIKAAFEQPRGEANKDIVNIVTIAKDYGFTLTNDEAHRFWEWNSERQAAQWLTVTSVDYGTVMLALCDFVERQLGMSEPPEL